jgi:hypothetical protein
MSEPMIPLLAELPQIQPDAGQSERIRTRCRARLAREAPRASGPSVRTAPVWQSLIAILGIAYLTEVIVQAVHLYGP